MSNAVAIHTDKTHYRKAFDSPYLSSADITEPTALVIARVTLESDKTKKSKDQFNTAYFAERELRPGEKLKPMILNATNSRAMKAITGSAFIEDWVNVPVSVYVDPSVRFGKDTVEGLRIMRRASRPRITPDQQNRWDAAKAAFKRDGNLEAVLAKAEISEEHQRQLISECAE